MTDVLMYHRTLFISKRFTSLSFFNFPFLIFFLNFPTTIVFLGDGLIQHKELHDVIRACMEENGMEFSDDQIEDLTTAMFEDADPYNRGEITYEALKNQLHKHGGLLENLSIT